MSETQRVAERRAMDLKYWTGFVEGVESMAKLLVELWGGFQGFFDEWQNSWAKVSGGQIGELRGVLQEEEKAAVETKAHRQQDVEVKFGEGLNMIGEGVQEALGEVEGNCEQFVGGVEGKQREVLKEASTFIDAALAAGENFVKAGKSKLGVVEGQLAACGGDTKRLKNLLADIKVSIGTYGDSMKQVGMLEEAEKKVGEMLEEAEKKAMAAYEKFSGQFGSVSGESKGKLEAACVKAKGAVAQKTEEGKEKEVARFRASEVVLGERVEGLVRAVEGVVANMTNKQEILCVQDGKRLEGGSGATASSLVMLAEEFKGTVSKLPGNADVEEQVKVIDALLNDRKGRIAIMVEVGEVMLKDEKNRQQVTVKSWLTEHSGEMRKLWSDYVEGYVEQAKKFGVEDEEMVKVKGGALEGKVAEAVKEVEEGLLKALEVCEMSCASCGGNKETAAALKSVGGMKAMVEKNAGTVADDLGKMAEKIEGVLHKANEEERRQTVRVQEEEARKKAAAAAAAAQQQGGEGNR